MRRPQLPSAVDGWDIRRIDHDDRAAIALVDRHLPTIDGRSPRTLRESQLRDLLHDRYLLRHLDGDDQTVVVADVEPVGSRAARHYRIQLDASEGCRPQQWAAAWQLALESVQFTNSVRKVSVLVDDSVPAAAAGCELSGLVNEGYLRGIRFSDGHQRDVWQYSTPEEVQA